MKMKQMLYLCTVYTFPEQSSRALRIRLRPHSMMRSERNAAPQNPGNSGISMPPHRSISYALCNIVLQTLLSGGYVLIYSLA